MRTRKRMLGERLVGDADLYFYPAGSLIALSEKQVVVKCLKCRAAHYTQNPTLVLYECEQCEGKANGNYNRR